MLGRRPDPQAAVATANAAVAAVHVNSAAPMNWECQSYLVPSAALGVLVSVSLLWLVWAIALTAQPNTVVNALMATKEFDFGTFWLLSDAPPLVADIGVVGLAAIASGYLVILGHIAKLLRGRSASVSHFHTNTRKQDSSRAYRVATQDAVEVESWPVSIKRVFNHVATHAIDAKSSARRRMASTIKIGEILIQSMLLQQLLEGGLPISICGLFATVVALNAAMSFVFALLPFENMGRIHVLVDTGIDFVMAVGFPAIQLLYAVHAFNFDRKVFQLHLAISPPGAFETTAAAVADPSTVEMIRNVLNSLRVDSTLKLFTRVGTSLSLWYGFIQLTRLLQAQLAGVQTYPNVYPIRNRFFATIYALLFVAILVYTEESVRTTQQACAMHPECAQYAHRWIFARREDDWSRCPCISMIDRRLAVATYNDWVTPPSRVSKVAQLAASGNLRTLQLVNLGLETIPEQLRKCTKLKQVSLYYTNTRILPDWFSEFSNLEFLHIEGKAAGSTPQASLDRLPAHLFDRMDKLVLLHIAAHELRELPRLDGLVNVRSITLAILLNVVKLPNFSKLHNLERLMISSMTNLLTVPQLDGLAKLTMFAALERGAFCCNGFLNACNLTSPMCTYNRLWNVPAVTECVAADEAASPATRAVFDRFRQSSCTGVLQPRQIASSPPRAWMEVCNGTLFRQCVVPGLGASGICYNSRWMAVACTPSPIPITMRREQIAAKIGEPCDPAVEKWLGCGS